MKAILINQPGDPQTMRIGKFPTPKPGPEEVLVLISNTAINRADTLQRRGKYPPPTGESPIMGLEMAGEVVETGPAVTKWQPGDRVCGLLSGGGYAQYATIHQDLALPVPGNLTFAEAAAIPEVFMTAFQSLIWLGELQTADRVLIHAGASGVGTAAIQLAREIGAEVLVTASRSKHSLCQELGASLTIDYKNTNFKEAVQEFTHGNGVDVIIDFVAGPYFQDNLDLLGMDGRMVLLAMLGGPKTNQINLAPILQKRLQIMGSTLRSRSLSYKVQLARALYAFAWPRFQKGHLKPVIDRVIPWQQVAEAHRIMEANENSGKIVLEIN